MAQDVIETTLPPIQSGADGGGSSDLISGLMNDVTGTQPQAPAGEPAPKPEPGQPAPGEKKGAAAAAPKPGEAADKKPTPAAPAKGAAAPAPKPSTQPAAQKRDVNPDDPKLTATELRQHLKQVIEDSKKTVAQKEQELSTTKNKLQQLESKRFWTEDDEKSQSALTQRQAALESQLYGRDYAASDEYKKLYTDKLNEQGKDANDVVQSLTVRWNEGDEEKTRTGNWNDVLRLYNAPNNAERRKLAKELFGEDFQEVLDAVVPMVGTRKAADQAVKDKTANYQSETQQRALKQREEQGKFSGFIKQQSDALAEKYPDIFKAPDDNPDVAAQLKRGFDFVDECSSKQNMDINERAARAALVRSWAGAFPRLVFELRQSRAELAALKEENSKYRKADPGGAGDNGGGGGNGTGGKDGGSDDMASEFDKMGR